MFTNSGIVKLIDFGVCKDMRDSMVQTPTLYVLWYRPPEVIFGLKYSYASDLWAVGIIGVEMLLGEPLFLKCTTDLQLLSEIRLLFNLRSITKENLDSIDPIVQLYEKILLRAKINDTILSRISSDLAHVNPQKRSCPDLNFVSDGTRVEIQKKSTE
jgi:serine/threonine protein kinase